MRILAINDHPYYGGAAQLFKRTNTILKNAGHEIFEITCDADLTGQPDLTNCLTNSQPSESYGTRFVDKGKKLAKKLDNAYFKKYVSYIINNCRNNCRHLSYPALTRYLRYVLTNYKFDIAHIHNLHGNMSTEVFPVISSFKIPIVYQINDYYFFCNTYFAYNKRLDLPCKRCIHGNALWALCYNCSQYFGHGNPFIEVIRRFLLNLKNPWKHINSCIVTGDKTLELLVDFGFKKERIYKSKNTMTLKEFDIPVSMGKSFIFYGSFHTLKGTDTFLKSLEYVDGGIEVGYYVLGTTQQYLDHLISICKKRNIELKYDCKIEWRNGLREIIAQAYSVIVPSKWWVTSENVVYEGMLLGKAMIIGNSGGNVELIKDGETGILFNANDPFDLASRINFLNKNRGFGEKIGQNAYKESRKLFSEERFLSNLLDIYNKTILNAREVAIRQ